MMGQDDIRALTAFFHEAELVACPCVLCGNSEFSLLTRLDRHDLGLEARICQVCGMVMTNPRPSDEWYEQFYGEFFWQVYQGHRFSDMSDMFEKDDCRGKAQAILDVCAADLPEHGTYLDFGSGLGGTLSEFTRRHPRWQVFGVDPSVESLAFSQQMLAGTGAQTVSGLDAPELTGVKFDMITAVHVLEHILQPLKFLKELRDRMNDRGRIYVEVPNLVSDEWIGKGFFHVAHSLYFTPESLCCLMAKAGLRVISTHRGVFADQWPWGVGVVAVPDTSHSFDSTESQGSENGFSKIQMHVRKKLSRDTATIVFDDAPPDPESHLAALHGMLSPDSRMVPVSEFRNTISEDDPPQTVVVQDSSRNLLEQIAQLTVNRVVNLRVDKGHMPGTIVAVEIYTQGTPPRQLGQLLNVPSCTKQYLRAMGIPDACLCELPDLASLAAFVRCCPAIVTDSLKWIGPILELLHMAGLSAASEESRCASLEHTDGCSHEKERFLRSILCSPEFPIYVVASDTEDDVLQRILSVLPNARQIASRDLEDLTSDPAFFLLLNSGIDEYLDMFIALARRSAATNSYISFVRTPATSAPYERLLGQAGYLFGTRPPQIAPWHDICVDELDSFSLLEEMYRALFRGPVQTVTKTTVWENLLRHRRDRFRIALRELCRNRNARVVIAGAGHHTDSIADLIEDARGHIVAILDDRQLTEYRGIDVIPFRDVMKCRPDAVLISSDSAEAAISQRLRQEGCPAGMIRRLYSDQ